MADKNDRSPTPADRRRQKREAKEAKARERRIRARQGDRRLFPKVSKKAATAFVAVVAVLFVLSVFWLDSDAPGSEPVASGSVDGSTEVQVADGQYLELRGCVATVLG